MWLRAAGSGRRDRPAPRSHGVWAVDKTLCVAWQAPLGTARSSAVRAAAAGTVITAPALHRAPVAGRAAPKRVIVAVIAVSIGQACRRGDARAVWAAVTS